VPPTLPPSARHWLPAHLATAALLLLIIVSSFFAFGPGRPGRQGQLPAVLPIMSGTPEAQEPVVTETLLQASVAAMPAGAAGIWVNSYVMQPGAISPYDRVHGPVVRGSVVYTVEHGTVTITLGDVQRMLSAGDTWSVLTETGYAIENTGSDEAHLVFVELIDTVASSGSGNANGPFIDGMSGTWDTWIEASPNLPGGPGQVTLQRVTLAPGAALPTYTESGLDWLGIRAGRLTVRLEGERLPFRWKSGAERAFGRAQILPVFPAGSQVTLRNAGDDPLILHRLTITPRGGETTASATPAAGDPTKPRPSRTGEARSRALSGPARPGTSPPR
jgi:quercetin dioxygenase-like cupin family protein